MYIVVLPFLNNLFLFIMEALIHIPADDNILQAYSACSLICIFIIESQKFISQLE